MRSSLTLKLIAAFAGICILEALLVAFLVREATQRSFDEYLREEAIEVFESDVREYFARTETLEGVHRVVIGGRGGALASPRGNQPPGPRPGGPGARSGEGRTPPSGGRSEGHTPPPNGSNGGRMSRPPAINPKFGLTNHTGEVLISNGDHGIGDTLTAAELTEGIPLDIDGTIEGYILMPSVRMAQSEREVAYLNRVDISLLWASVGVVLFAVVLGVWLAQGYTKPIKALTTASRALADGELGRQVEVTSTDEVGELSESFNRMSAQLKEIAAQRRQLTSDIAHDLRTPLTVLSGYLEALRNEELSPTPERFEMLHQEAQHLSRLVDDLRVLALADAGELQLNLQPADIGHLLEGVQDAFQNQAQKAGVKLGVTCDESLVAFHLDAGRIKQVLTNLVGNALRYTPEDGSITLRALGEKDQLRIDVIDTGTGISSEALPHLFDRFYRADDSRQRAEGGTGLGLAIAKSLVEAHGGIVSVSSVEGQGSTFTILLP